MILCGCHGLDSCPSLQHRATAQHAPKQLGDVVNVDQLDTADRQKLPWESKLELLCVETRNATGRDPRGGGHVFVARPRIVLSLLIDCRVDSLSRDVVLDRAVKFGTLDADVVARWCEVPIVVRCTVVDDNLHCVRLDRLPPASGVDRARAGQLRVAAHSARLKDLLL